MNKSSANHKEIIMNTDEIKRKSKGNHEEHKGNQKETMRKSEEIIKKA
jgi:hypothetical protein